MRGRAAPRPTPPALALARSTSGDELLPDALPLLRQDDDSGDLQRLVVHELKPGSRREEPVPGGPDGMAALGGDECTSPLRPHAST
jgi:hypothetical protein